MAKKGTKEKLKLIRERAKTAIEADRENRAKALEDLRFVNEPGCQWDDSVKTERGDRPCYEFNKLRVTIKRVVNDMRANRPSGKVRPVEESDIPTAEVLEGLIRNIWNACDADTVIDHAAEYQVGGGMCAWRVKVGYSDDSAFEQDIEIVGFKNPLCVYPDPACKDPLHRDARYWIITDKITKTAYEERWPNAEVVDFESDTEFDDDTDDWDDEENVRIVEYWYREPVKRVLHLMSDGSTVDAADTASMAAAQAKGLQSVRSREMMSDQIRMCIASGKAILEEGEWAGKEFPFIIAYGESLIIDGRHRWFGLTRFAKDAQRSYNFSRTLAAETVALAPQAKWWATPTQTQGNDAKWAEAHKKNYPYLIFNPDPQNPGAPQMMAGPQVPMALIQEMQISSDDIKNVTGIFDPSLGKQSNETSGVAIRARQEQGEIAVFNFKDNMSKGVLRTWEILVDLIPKIYDTERSVRILGRDGAEKYLKVNKPNPDGSVVNDLGRGKFDVVVTVGPSYSTQRQEAAETYWKFANANPALMGVIGDLMFKATDLPYAEQIANRLKLMLPQPIQQAEAKEVPMPPEVVQMMAQAEQAMQQVQQMMQGVQQMGAEAQQASAEAQSEKQDVEKAKADLQIQMAKLETQHQKIIADITKRETAFLLQQAKAGTDEGGQRVEQDREALGMQVQAAVVELQRQAAEFMANAAQVMTQMQMQAQPQVVVQDPPKKKFIRAKLSGGREIVGTIEEAV